MSQIGEEVNNVLDKVQGIASTVESTVEQGKEISKQVTENNTDTNNLTSTPFISSLWDSTTKVMTWGILIFSGIMIVLIFLAKVYKNVDASFLMPYLVAFNMSSQTSYQIKSYAEKKNIYNK